LGIGAGQKGKVAAFQSTPLYQRSVVLQQGDTGTQWVYTFGISVIPEKAGIQTAGVFRWIPAYAGMTESVAMLTRAASEVKRNLQGKRVGGNPEVPIRFRLFERIAYFPMLDLMSIKSMTSLRILQYAKIVRAAYKTAEIAHTEFIAIRVSTSIVISSSGVIRLLSGTFK